MEKQTASNFSGKIHVLTGSFVQIFLNNFFFSKLIRGFVQRIFTPKILFMYDSMFTYCIRAMTGR